MKPLKQENTYFNKPSGILDQIGVAFSDANFIDFKDEENPVVIPLAFDLPLSLYLISSEGDHKDLTDLYKGIPLGMQRIANIFHKNYLRDVSKEEFESIQYDFRYDEKDINKAYHFYLENSNVLTAKKAILVNDADAFLDAIRSSQASSYLNLENTYVKDEYENSPQEIIDNVSQIPGFDDWGAIRIHGGGFKGTVLAFIKNEWADDFTAYLELNYKNRYTKVGISKVGVLKEKINL